MKALLFSGGKDSCACLFLHQHEWDDIEVIWINTGKNYPEMMDIINWVRGLVPNFVEIEVNKDRQNEVYGLPSDLVPVDYSNEGFVFNGSKDIKIQSKYQCCNQNISLPALTYIIERGFTEVIRGQRSAESYKSPVKGGTTVNGITFIHPIEDWTDEQVLEYVSQFMIIPDHFRFNHTSLDCYDCTAYLKESKDRLEWAEQSHPDLHYINMHKLIKVREAINTVYKDVFHNGT